MLPLLEYIVGYSRVETLNYLWTDKRQCYIKYTTRVSNNLILK